MKPQIISIHSTDQLWTVFDQLHNEYYIYSEDIII